MPGNKQETHDELLKAADRMGRGVEGVLLYPGRGPVDQKPLKLYQEQWTSVCSKASKLGFSVTTGTLGREECARFAAALRRVVEKDVAVRKVLDLLGRGQGLMVRGGA
jgi:hypothetical protein